MNPVETIDCLCEIIERQAALIRSQAIFIEEQLAVEREIRGCFKAQSDSISSEIEKVKAVLMGGFPFVKEAV